MHAGDWAEFASSLGFPTWKSLAAPCFCCNGHTDNLYDFLRINALSLPWQEHKQEDYEHACQLCERWVVIETTAMHAHILGVLRYDKRAYGFHGRALCNNIPSLGMLIGDRLEPSPSLLDIAEFDLISRFPCEVLFWRTTVETLVHHRCPLFNIAIGVTTLMICIDTLHTLHLGVIKYYIQVVFWRLLLHEAFEADGTQHERIIIGVQMLRMCLWQHYDEIAQSSPYIKAHMCKLQNLTPKMLGTPLDQKLKTKGAETGWLLSFAIKILKDRGGQVPYQEELVAAGEALQQYMSILKAEPRRMSIEALNNLHQNCKRHLMLLGEAEVPYQPKHHLFVHLTTRAAFSGNPRFTSTFLDESYNGKVAEIGRGCHRNTWHKRVYERFSLRFGGLRSSLKAALNGWVCFGN